MKRIIVFLVLVLVSLSSASYISMTPSIEASDVAVGGAAVVNLSLSNGGDETAYDVFASLVLPAGFSAKELYFGSMDPGESFSGSFSVSAGGDAAPGTYSVTLLVDYKDANGYPFSAVHVFSVNLDSPSFSEVSPRVSSLEIAGGESGVLEAVVKNRGEEAREVEVELILPRELSSDLVKKPVVVQPKSEEKLSFSVSSFDALPGSSYMVFAIVSYEEDGIHRSSYAGGVVSIVAQDVSPGKDPFAYARENLLSGLLLFVLAALAFGFVIYQFKK